MRPQLSEILTEINNDLDLLGTKYKNDRAIFNLIKYSMNENFKFNLKEGKFVYPDAKFVIGYAPVSLYTELLSTKLDIFARKDLKESKMNHMFFDFITQLDSNDAEIIFNIKDQTLYTMYPKFTKALILPYFTNEK